MSITHSLSVSLPVWRGPPKIKARMWESKEVKNASVSAMIVWCPLDSHNCLAVIDSAAT
jgi:hypothetical protein